VARRSVSADLGRRETVTVPVTVVTSDPIVVGHQASLLLSDVVNGVAVAGGSGSDGGATSGQRQRRRGRQSAARRPPWCRRTGWSRRAQRHGSVLRVGRVLRRRGRLLRNGLGHLVSGHRQDPDIWVYPAPVTPRSSRPRLHGA
jgi:hypothetical protein